MVEEEAAHRLSRLRERQLCVGRWRCGRENKARGRRRAPGGATNRDRYVNAATQLLLKHLGTRVTSWAGPIGAVSWAVRVLNQCVWLDACLQLDAVYALTSVKDMFGWLHASERACICWCSIDQFVALCLHAQKHGNIASLASQARISLHVRMRTTNHE
jgi:hypothetical protein